MKYSRNLHRKQTTQNRDCLAEVGVQLQDRQGVPSSSLAVSKRESENRAKDDTSNLMEKILARNNMIKAYKRVKANKGSHGIDGMSVDELRDFLRLIQQAIAQELTKIYDPTFSDNSYGFRPNKSAHDAIQKAKQHINQGYRWVVDIDLEKFFDRVNHDILMRKLSEKIKDKRLLTVIRRYLSSGVMVNGVKISSEEGTPQGGPLSPLLANILLDQLDKELDKRGHRYCRYADDCNIYVKSKKAGERVMASIKDLLENKLKLGINQNKSAVDLVSRRKFLGFSFYFSKGECHIRIHEKSYKRFKDRIRELTNRNSGIGMEYRLRRLNDYTTGWINYFAIANAKSRIQVLEGWIRRRLRACIWKQWKKIKTRGRNLIKLGLPEWKAWEFANTRKGYWRISNSPILASTITNDYLENLGYRSIYKRYCRLSKAFN